jgi:starch phosphorylase
MIWAGKPYPEDTGSIDVFNDIYTKTKSMPNCAILTGYELGLSGLLKGGSDAWLNNPKIYREASGTSGMSAAMKGSINVSIPDGWVPEFAKHGKNSFCVEAADTSLDDAAKNRIEADNIYKVIESEIIPTYYNKPEEWFKIMSQAWSDVKEEFDANRMAREYYEELYN